MKNIICEKAKIDDIDQIINMYKERMEWFKENKIYQWRKYLTNHPKEEFIKSIKNENYYVIKFDGEIVAGFEISTDSHFWNDDVTKAYYINKIVVRVGYKNLGKEIFKICENIAIENKKEYLRIECTSSNKKLNEIYNKHGFKYIKSGHDYYYYTLREYKIKK